MSIGNEMSIQNILDWKMSICVKKSIILDNSYSVEYTTEIFESWSFIKNTKGKKVLSLNEYSNVFYQNPQSEIFKVWMAFEQCQQNRWVGPFQWLLEHYRGMWELGGRGAYTSHPILTDQLGRLCPPHFYSPLQIFRPSTFCHPFYSSVHGHSKYALILTHWYDERRWLLKKISL